MSVRIHPKHAKALSDIYDALAAHLEASDNVRIIRANFRLSELEFGYPEDVKERFEQQFNQELISLGNEEYAALVERPSFIWGNVEKVFNELPQIKVAIMCNSIQLGDMKLFDRILLSALQRAWAYAIRTRVFAPEHFVELANAHLTEINRCSSSYWNDVAHAFERLSYFAK